MLRGTLPLPHTSIFIYYRFLFTTFLSLLKKNMNISTEGGGGRIEPTDPPPRLNTPLYTNLYSVMLFSIFCALFYYKCCSHILGHFYLFIVINYIFFSLLSAVGLFSTNIIILCTITYVPYLKFCYIHV